MPFIPKLWRSYPDTSTPLNAAAFMDLEARLADYAETLAGAPSNPITVRTVSPIGNNPYTFLGDHATWIIRAAPTASQPINLTAATDTNYIATGVQVDILNGGSAPMPFVADVGVQLYPTGVSALAPGDRASITYLGSNLYWVDVPRRSQIHLGAPQPDMVQPVISLAGSTFSLDYAGAWGGDIASYQIQWYRGGVAITPAETGVTKAKVPADDGTTITCRVLATDKLNRQSAVGMLSNSIVMPSTAVAPSNTRPARILLANNSVPGASVPVGTALIVDPGDWTGSPTFTAHWYNPPAGGGAPADRGIVSVAPYGYTTLSTDQNETVYAVVTATNGSGSTTYTTAALAVGAASPGGGAPGPTAGLKASIEYDIAGAGGPTVMSEQLPDRVPSSYDWGKWPR